MAPGARSPLSHATAADDRARALGVLAGRPTTIERLAGTPLVFYDAESADADPIRRQLAERAQARGVCLRPRVESSR